MRVWFAIVGLFVGVALGAAGALALNDPVQPEAQDSVDAAEVPEPCLAAISAARDRLLLNPDVLETLRDYRDLAEELRDELSAMRLPNLRQSLGELNDLRDRSAELIDRSVNTRFSAAANECESIAAERGAAPTPTS